MSDKFGSQKQQSSVSVFYEQIVQEYQRQELAQMATLDKIAESKSGKSKKKQKGGMASAVSSTEKIRTWTEHLIDQEDLAKQLETVTKVDPMDKEYHGLTEHQAVEALKKWGPNTLTEKKGLPWYLEFLLALTGLFNYLLWSGSLLCFISYGVQEDKSDASNLYLGIVLALVVIITAIFSYSQTSKSAALMAQFKNFIPPKAQVFREGKRKEINAAELVPGDIVFIDTGDNIPADVVLIKTSEMKVNNASLTGESEELLRIPEEKAKNIFESPNVGFFGTACTSGNGVGIVFKTGDLTVIGQIANLASSAETSETPLSLEIERFIKFISTIAVSLGVIFFILGFIYGYDAITNLIFMIGIIVANVPEGLLVTVTVCLALTAKKMAQKMVLVKNLESVETLGSTSCICSDKTGTLTQNKMTVSHLFYDFGMVDASISYDRYLANKQIQLGYNINDVGFKELMQAVTLGTKASFQYMPTSDEMKTQLAKIKNKKSDHFKNHVLTEDEKKMTTEALLKAEADQPITNKKCVGDASETGLIKFIQPMFDLEDYRRKYPVFTFQQDGKPTETMIPFSSEIKFNMYVRDMNENDKNPLHSNDGLMLVMKGAPERILSRCSKILINGEEREFDAAARAEVNKANDQLGKLGERVLAFARYNLEPKIYTKTPPYPFDVKGWKKWKDVTERDENIKGWFPMFNLTLVGLVSLNDPPRPRVDMSVSKCRQAGIKVIMVTGDQPPTAAAIAHKVNIITNPALEYNYLKDEMKMSPEEAWEKCRAIVIHGDLLAEKHAQEENLDDMDPEKGRFLIEWISKPEVVFARTTPSQKLLIVDACQRAGHVVAVTGDGVNDSPAIKKANIGIAMGSGSDVAKNAADMLLLDDNFSSIVNGVEQGRVIFDNLKKSITYTLSSNIPELVPFLSFIIVQIPLPLSTILILCVDIGTDMYPAVSFAYEYAELDIMERMPRHSKRDHLVSAKLLSFAYMQTGCLQTASAFYTYCYVMNDYGIRPVTMLFLALEKGYFPHENDSYDPNLPNFGNTQYGYDRTTIFWDGSLDSYVDIRLFYVHRQRNEWSNCRWDPKDTDIPRFWRISDVSDTQICYTTEAQKYGQGAFLISVIVSQWANLLICKTRTLSLSQQELGNQVANTSLIFETALIIFISYVPPLEVGLGTRAVACSHFAIPGMSWFMIIFFYDEVRKIYLRHGIDKSEKGKIKYTGWIARNTFW